MVSRVIVRTVVGTFLITVFCFTWVVFGAIATQQELEANQPPKQCRGQFGHVRPQSFCDKLGLDTK